MRLRNITLAGVILLVLAFTTGMAGATENSTANETINATGATTESLTVNPTENITVPADESDDDGAAKGIFGPGHLLYRLQIAFDKMGEVFTFNESEKLGKQVSNARHRINEYRAALKENDTEAADIALAEYDAEMNDMNKTMSGLSDNDTGLNNAKMMIMKHQLILENLSISHPNNTGLQRALNNSQILQTKFASKKGLESDLSGARDDRGTPRSEKTVVTVKDEKPEKGTKR